MTGPAHADHNEPSRLSELLQCEVELERLRARARDEAAELVSRALREADARKAELDSALEVEMQGLRARMRREAREEIQRTLDEGEARAARYEAVPEGEVERLAESAFRWLVGVEGQ